MSCHGLATCLEYKHTSQNCSCTTPYMRQNIKINIGVGGLHGNQFAKIDQARDRMRKQFTSYLLPFLMTTNTSETRATSLQRGWLAHGSLAAIATPVTIFDF